MDFCLCNPHSAVFGWKDERFFVREAKDALHIQFVLIALKTLAWTQKRW